MTRRQALATALAGATAWAQDASGAHQATGLKTGEITPSSAVIWARHTVAPVRFNEGIVRKGHVPIGKPLRPDETVDAFEGACPGAPGYVRLRLEPLTGRRQERLTPWVEVGPETDFSHQFRLADLTPATPYRFVVETKASQQSKTADGLGGQFRTGPSSSDSVPVTFALSSCQMYCRMDRPEGFAIYDAIRLLDPAFLASCGDNVYYDSEDPVVTSIAPARYHWHRMYSLPTLRAALLRVPGYWQKDDHDGLTNDYWPGIEKYPTKPFSLEEGKRIFREQVPAPEQPTTYRRFRWGKALEVWFTEARDFRAPNNEPDGPNKSLWGEEQKRWLKQTLLESDASWKIVINPNPIVGPDHIKKNDNHANPGFATEGLEFRRWVHDTLRGQVIVMNGDRHWQYHSVDPESGLHEFGCGPASDEHAIAPSSGHNPKYHRFLNVKGGFLVVTVDPSQASQLVVEHRDVTGKTVYRHAYTEKDRVRG
jgi:alkaline phosphatase D